VTSADKDSGDQVTLVGLEAVRLAIPLVSPFRTSFGTETARDVLLLRAVVRSADGGQVQGWGECVSGEHPYYSSEYVEASLDVLARYLAPAVSALDHLTPQAVAPATARIKGHRMAKAALESAVLDAWLRTRQTSLADYLGATRQRVACGVSVGIMDSIGALLDAVTGYLEDGYRRVKLKIEPGWDVEPVRAVRERFGDQLVLQVDANTAYARGDIEHLAGLDPFGLLLIEQPFDTEDLLGHAALARAVRTPICLDESIESARLAEDAISLGACSIVNIKPGRVGGYLEARRIHDVCRAAGVAVWCGGMLETGIGRAANLALAALPGFILPGDTSASRRYFHRDVTTPFELDDGMLAVPTGPGIGVEPLPEVLAELTTARHWLIAP
jgi:O-succinylbenzoate synthase